MFNDGLTLDIFVSSISICQPEADLGSILNIFQSGNRDLLAIPFGDGNWGTIRAQDILSLLTNLWQEEGMAMVGHPKNLLCQARTAYLQAQHFSYLIKPAIVYPSSTKLQTFLSNLDHNFLSDSSQEYLITNELGKLQGRLDSLKILKYLASDDTREEAIDSKQPDSINALLPLLNSVALPLKIETSTGEDFYANQCWHELVATIHATESPQLLPDNEIASWWLEQQSSKEQQVLEQTDYSQASKLPTTCCGTLFPFSLPRQTIELKLAELPPSLISHSVDKNIAADLVGLTAGSSFELQIEQKQNWHQIKIPLVLTNFETFSSAEPSYWLVLFAQASDQDVSTKQSSEDIFLVFKTIVNELLGTISHELKSPITGIIGLSSLLKDPRMGELNQRQTRYTHLIGNSGQKLMGIVNDLIELVSLSNGEFKLNPEAINLKSFCYQLYQQTLEKLQMSSTSESEFSFLSVQLGLNIEAGLEVTVADKRCLSAILSYLLIETLQFTDLNQDTVAITIKREYSREDSSDRQKIKIMVSNDINPNSLPAVSLSDSNGVKKSSGWNIILAKYIGQMVQADIQSTYSANGCQLTLLWPVTNSQESTDLCQPDSAVTQQQDNLQRNITILCLYPEPEQIDPIRDRNSGLNFNLKNWAEQDWSNISEQQSYQHRIIEADGLEQAHTLARIWRLDVIVLDGYQIIDPAEYLRSLQESEYLAALPLVTLDTRTTEAANQIEGFDVYPCLLPAECRSIKDLIQVIQIATGV